MLGMLHETARPGTRRTDGAPVEPRGRACRQPRELKRVLLQGQGQSVGGSVAHAARGDVNVRPDVNHGPQKRTRGQNNIARAHDPAVGQDQALDVIRRVNLQVLCRAGQQGQIGCVENQFLLHGRPIQVPVHLGAGAVDGRTLAAVERAVANTSLVGQASHDAIQSVDFLYQNTLANASHGRVAGHFPDGLDFLRHQQRASAHASRGRRSFAASVPPSDDNDIKRTRQVHQRQGGCRRQRLKMHGPRKGGGRGSDGKPLPGSVGTRRGTRIGRVEWCEVGGGSGGECTAANARERRGGRHAQRHW